MLVVIADLLNSDEVGLLREKMRHVNYVDGRVTAGREARPVKQTSCSYRSTAGGYAETHHRSLDEQCLVPYGNAAKNRTPPHVQPL